MKYILCDMAHSPLLLIPVYVILITLILITGTPFVLLTVIPWAVLLGMIWGALVTRKAPHGQSIDTQDLKDNRSYIWHRLFDTKIWHNTVPWGMWFYLIMLTVLGLPMALALLCICAFYLGMAMIISWYIW